MWCDLEQLCQTTDASLPEEMTPGWFNTLFMSLGGLTARNIDFCWASPRYGAHLGCALSVTTWTPLLTSVKREAPHCLSHLGA